ncbi:hypothetical protein H0H81_011921 [Sphagnurus paluster]|uniref:Uncharacterized protein n=1 Tax=Sphagnurus paluster TaxID=117069 RepID=A0A9P7GP77_9AGAR|nr:hypothetical protein H0H81_011921 [Sphagnurus paluster]
MPSNVQTLSRPTTAATPQHPPPIVPSIRLISATPSAAGNSSTSSVTNYTIDASWGSIPTPLAPKTENNATRKRLVPKKSKLSMLSGAGREKERGKDLSDVVRRVGVGSSTARGGFDIYVDPTVDEDIGEIVMVKKKKSRVALDGMRWGALGEVTNVPAVSAPKEAPGLLKVKSEEKEKWWSIGRGRKDSKEKTKETREKSTARAKSPEPTIKEHPTVRDPYPRSKTPEPLKLSAPMEPSRARFNSLDSGILLSSPAIVAPQFADQQGSKVQPAEPSTLTYSRAGTPTAGGLLAPPQPTANHQGSIALRAMRSVRSLARIGSWAQLKGGDENAAPGSVRIKDKKEKEKAPKEKKAKDSKKKKENAGEDEGKKKKKKSKDKKEKEKEKEAAATIRMSTSSFEIGAASPMPKEKSQTLGKKKQSILGLGLPSSMTMRLPNVRSGSTASSIGPPATQRLSVESAHLLKQGRDRSGSMMSTSTASSLRPLSTTSSVTGSRLSSGSSIRWDEDCLENVKELRRRERKEKAIERANGGAETEKGSRRTAEGRKRTPLSEVFGRSPSPVEDPRPKLPIVTVEAATCDGHGEPDDHSILEEEEEILEDQPLETPVKRARARPMSEQLLGKSRPKPMYESEDGVLSILDAATNDLAQLINHLDLEATPATPDMTPLKPYGSATSSKGSPGTYELESPTKNKSRNLLSSESPAKKSPHHVSSISSLRPYAQSRRNFVPTATEGLIGQQIAPWQTLIQNLSPVKPAPKKEASPSTNTPVKTLRMTHRRTMTPGPEPDPSPVFQPLRPAKSRNALATLMAPVAQKDNSPFNSATVRAPSLRTFGSVSSRMGSPLDDASPTPSPVFKREPGHRRQRSSLVPVGGDQTTSQRTRGGSRYNDDNDTVPIPPETRRILGMSGTMGGSDVSAFALPLVDASDPDSDIPDELQHILCNQSDDGETMSYHDEDCDMSVPRSLADELSSGPPVLELPSFHAKLIDDEENHADIDTGGNSSDEDFTKKSFDFTGEIKKLNESGGSDRASFLEQLENAFRTPAKIDLHYGFSNFLAPPVPKLPEHLMSQSSQSSSEFDSYSGSNLADMKEPTLLHASMTTTDDNSEGNSGFEMLCGMQSLDIKEVSLLPGSDSLATNDATEDVIMSDDSIISKSLRSSASTGSRPSDGQLNTSFKFGGLPKAPHASALPAKAKPQTLADIIPPPSHVRSLSNTSMMEEDEDSVLKSIFAQASGVPIPRPRVRVNSDSSPRSRMRNSGIQYRHSRHSSAMSFVGFDSFDEVRRGFEISSERPFYPPVATRRSTRHNRHESLFSIASVSSYGRAHDYGLSDPFDYGLPSLRERPSSEDMSSMSMSVDDTFSFINHQPRRRVESDASSFYFKAPMQSFSRGHRRHESNMSVSSQAPPVSLYNRSFGTHRRNDSSSSAQSFALSYAMHGASGGRAAWARHRQEGSVDSIMSDFSAMRLGRPGIGDKMFDTAVEQGAPLTSISASPPESVAERRYSNRSSFDFDSIIDQERRSSMYDSLFEKTGDRSSFSSDSVFGGHDSRIQRNLPQPRYRPLSVLSMDSVHSPIKEDDTMISMLGGGHVRRRSIDASPCVKIGKRKHSAFQGTQLFAKNEEYRESPIKARIVEKPSIASTSSSTFGGERMIKAKRGLLERQSLEDSCLIADGEELSASLQSMPMFSRPGPATRSRSSTCTSSSGGDTPPLSISDGFSSMDEGSQSSIDLSHVNFALANATHPISTIARNRVRARARGQGHRRRASHARASRSSVYETIQEEMSPSPIRPSDVASKFDSPTICQPIFIVEPETADASPETSIWDDENGIIALRKYYALKDEAQTTVTESKRTWLDTPFSVFALQSFQVPRHPAGMQALLEHSVQNYGPLPSELRPRRMRSRTSSRPSPYPQGRMSKVIPQSSEKVQPVANVRSFGNAVLQQLPVNANITIAVPASEASKSLSASCMDIEPKRENAFGLAPNARPRVPSNARRSALGWSKRSTGKTSTDLKENVGQGTIMTPGETLRINRPRPRGRPTPASTARPIRI